MPEISARLGLPYIQPSQAQKHVTHNEALQQLDGVVQLSVLAFDAETPPATPAIGEVHALGAAPTGDWAGQAGRLAIRDETAWRFVSPGTGWRAWGQDGGGLRVWTGAAWAPALDLQNLDGLGIGTSSDAANPLAVAGPAALFTHDGAGHQLKLNKASAADTASLLFQSDWTGHAEVGLAGDNHLHIKVSADGAAWTEALVFDKDTGTASGAAVQADLTDAAADRLLKVGAFGLGADVNTRIADIDDHRTSGFYYGYCGAHGQATPGTNPFPDLGGAFGMVAGTSSIGTDGEYLWQQVFAYSAVGGMAAWRVRTSQTAGWQPWRYLYDTETVVGTVSASGGAPAGAVIERGSTATGDYMRLADGTQICSHSLTLDPANTAAGAGFQGAAVTGWSFPKAFAAGSRPAVQGSDASLGDTLVSAYCDGATAASFRAMRFTASATAPVVEVTAVGRWK